ncbi:MAG: dephospho-CoA kinase, partial [Acidimicrobiia bacterium]
IMAPEVPPDDRGNAETPEVTGRRVVVGGGIGAGKSAVCDVFAGRGYLVVSADEVGHGLLADDEPTIAAIADLWPGAVAGGSVDRAALASVVFSDARSLDRLEQIMHPRIMGTIHELVDARPTDDIVIEVPILPLVMDTPFLMAEDFTRVAVVADDRTRLARAVARGGDASDIAKRMNLQASDNAWRSWADVVVENSGSWTATEAAVFALIEGQAHG